ncbi:MAG TPA: PIN domain-containing protein [Polyangia bacterium]|nr:PIN domain-containing protein [Polyangia bacterium]
MTRVFVDTSALLALLVVDDEQHPRAATCVAELAREAVPLTTTSYVLLETYALLGRRHGPVAMERFRASFAPLLGVLWVDEDLHEAGLDRLVAGRGSGLSLVDAVSLVSLRRHRIERAFAFDHHLGLDGAEVIP